MLHYQFVTEEILQKVFDDFIKNKRKGLPKILKHYGVNVEYFNQAFAFLNVFGYVPNKMAFEMMRKFKDDKHKNFSNDYIKIEKIQSELKKILKGINDNKNNYSEAWITFKFGCDSSYKNFSVIVGSCYKTIGEDIFKYSNLNMSETKEFTNFQAYLATNPNVSINQGIAYKIFPLNTQQEIEDSFEKWFENFKNSNDKIYIYPGYSSYTTLIMTNDSILETKVATTNKVILNTLSFDLGNSCCPPY